MAILEKFHNLPMSNLEILESRVTLIESVIMEEDNLLLGRNIFPLFQSIV